MSPPDTAIPLDRAHYDLIVSTAERTRHIEEMLGTISGKLAACPCPAVADLQNDVETLQAQSAELRGKFAVIVSALGIVAGWIGSLLPGLLGRS